MADFQMNFVFCADNDKWDNNDGDNYLLIVNDESLSRPIPEELVEKFDEEANKIWADKYGAALFFTIPEKLKVLPTYLFCVLHGAPKARSISSWSIRRQFQQQDLRS